MKEEEDQPSASSAAPPGSASKDYGSLAEVTPRIEAAEEVPPEGLTICSSRSPTRRRIVPLFRAPDLSQDYLRQATAEAGGSVLSPPLPSVIASSSSFPYFPFERVDRDPGPYEIAKMVLSLFSLLPLRLLLCVLITLSYYVIARVSLLLATLFGKRPSLRLLTRIMSRFLLFAMGFHILEVYGEEDCGQRQGGRGERVAPIIVSNHLSVVEILYFMSSPSCPSFVMKEDCLKLPFVGTIAREILQSVSVNNQKRGSGGSAALLERLDAMATASPDEYRPLLLFPEGTTTNGTSLISFRSGAFLGGLPVQPVVVSLPFKHFSPTYETIWTEVFSLRLLMQVRYLPSYNPSPEEKQDPKLYAENVRNIMATALNSPLCDASYKDKAVYHKYLISQYRDEGVTWRTGLKTLRPIEVDPFALFDEDARMRLQLRHATLPLNTKRMTSSAPLASGGLDV